MSIQIFPGIEIDIGAPLNPQEIEKLPEGQRKIASIEHGKAIRRSEQEKTRKFYEDISAMYQKRKFDEILQKIAGMDGYVNLNLKEFIKIVLLVRLREPVRYSWEARPIVWSLKKIGGSFKDELWRSRLYLYIDRKEDIIFLADALKHEDVKDIMRGAIELWENNQHLSFETLRARIILGITVDMQKFRDRADYLLVHSGEKSAAIIYGELFRCYGSLKGEDGKDRAGILKAYDSGKEGFEKRMRNEAIKIELIQKPKKRWWQIKK